MTTFAGWLRVSVPSPARLRAWSGAADLPEAALRRRLAWIWGLLFLNVLPYAANVSLLPLPSAIGKVITQGALGVALMLAVVLNRRILVRPNLFLLLMTLLCVTTVVMSLRGYFGMGSVLRAVRLAAFVGGLWLLTPWWGRNDLLILRCHRQALWVLMAIVLLGLVVAPGHALDQAGGGRLGGTIWPMPPTQVAHYAALLAGTAIVLWFTGLLKLRAAALAAGVGVGVLLLTHTRTALVAFLVALFVAGLSLFLTRRRVRKVVTLALVVAALVGLSFAPFLTTWFTRGQTAANFSDLTGRTAVWTELVAQPRSDLNTLLGYGMSNGSFGGRSIDSGWLTVYLDQGLVGDAIVGAQFLLLLILAAFNPRGPRRALALFLIVYALVASITETGIGEASPYVLDLVVAASLLIAPVTGPPEPVTYAELPGPT